MQQVTVWAFLLITALAAVAGLPSDPTLPPSQWNCKGTPNQFPALTTAPTFVRQVPNGKLFQVGNENVDPAINVLHLWGTPYQMGYAAGQLMRTELQSFIPSVYSSLYAAIQPYIKDLPPDVQQMIAVNGTAAALQATYDLVAPYVEPWFLEEMQGWADGSGLDYSMYLQINMIPEMVQAACSMMGAWGPAVANANGALVQLRGMLLLPFVFSTLSYCASESIPTFLIATQGEEDFFPFSSFQY